MQRTQISLGEEERRLLDAAVARTGRSMSALIRQAVVAHFSDLGDVAADVGALEESFGAWGERDEDGEQYVDRLRSGTRWERLER